jgi:TPR repeat protein
MYDKGLGVPQSDKNAVEWYRKAAEQGYSPAQYHLGFMYEKGRGVQQSDKEAIEWYRKAAGQGYTDAKNKLKVLSIN